MAISKVSGSASRPSRNTKPATSKPKPTGTNSNTNKPKPSAPNKPASTPNAPQASEKPSASGGKLASALTESFAGLNTASRATVFIDDDHVGT
ncbi:MAG: hypothetical protein AB7S38_07755 [Vulcanimicrobiota bacterium]